jgi:hypothetical protein
MAVRIRPRRSSEPIIADAFERKAILDGKLSERLIHERTQAADEIERLRAVPEQLAAMIEGFSAEQIKMAAGEMTAQEMRSVKAVQRWWVSAMRHRISQQLGNTSK